ncbi:MAG: penicillin acylase family protein [Bryobacteraceae bacterium]
MAFNRLLKYINIGIAVVIAALLSLVYWFGYRPLPQTSGRVADFLAERAAVNRDSLGVPHIRAASLEDALAVQGYVTAQDRLWQMEGLRRLAAGELAEVFGPAMVRADRETRVLRLRRIAEAAAESMSPADRAAFAAYTRGVNQFLVDHLGRLPIEFTLLRHQPRPWRIADSVLVGLYMYRTLTESWKKEVEKRTFLAAGDPSKVNSLFPVRTGNETQPGSNAWAVSGSRTASGRPLLANDMHLDYSLPGIWYMTHLQAPGLNVAGVALPGCPGIIVGHNGRIAWGVTNLHFDVQDLYLETFDNSSGRYLFQGKPEQARREREVILVRGAAPVETAHWVTRHGPVVAVEGRHALSLQWTAATAERFEFPFLDLNRANNWEDFLRALSRFPGPGQNFVYADVDGNIGYHVAGRLPVRQPGHTGDLPVDGAAGEFEWESFIPFDKLPSAFNPPSGMIVSANQNPFPASFPYPVAGNFASHHRSSRIRELLAKRNGWRADEMLAVQTDIYSGFSHYMAQCVVAAWDRRKPNNPDLKPAVDLLRKWNGQMQKDAAAPLIATLLYQHLRKAAAESAAPGKGTSYSFQMAPWVVETLLRSKPQGWFPDYDETILRALGDAVDEGRRIQGRDITRWTYGTYIGLHLPSLLGRWAPWIGRYFEIGPVRQNGSSTTVKQTTRRMGPSMRMVVDLADLERSLLNVTTGQSGQILSKHYKDQWKAHYEGRSFPMRFAGVENGDVLEFVPER